MMNPIIIERIVAPALLLMGLSHLIQPRMWVRFFELERQSGAAGAIIGLYTLPLGLVLIVGHNVWVLDWPVFLTVCGWGMTIKSAIYLLVPSAADRALSSNTAKSEWSYRFVGALAAVISAIITWQAWAPMFH
jgi:uncharacterized protein YjeT (DUF2065 family)